MFSQIKDRKDIEQNFRSVAKVMPRGGTAGVKNFNVGICDGAPSTVRSSDFVTFPFGILGQVWYLIVSIPDLAVFLTSHKGL